MSEKRRNFFILEDVDGVATGFVAEGVRVWAGNGEGGLGAGCGLADGGFYDVLVAYNEAEDDKVQAHDGYQPL